MTSILERVFTRHERAALFRNWAGAACMLPKGGEAVWGNETWAADQPSFMNGSKRTFGSLIAFSEEEAEAFREMTGLTLRNMTVEHALDMLAEYTDPFFAKMFTTSYSHGVELRDLQKPKYDDPKYWVNPLESALPKAPNLSVYCLYGVGKPTERSYFYTLTNSQKLASLDGAGDGTSGDTVLFQSLSPVVSRWEIYIYNGNMQQFFMKTRNRI